MSSQKDATIRLSDALKKYAERQTARLLDDLRASVIGRERDGVHNLRVDIKRLRAYVRLIERIDPSFDAAAAFRPVRRLFRHASELRDLHVQLAFLKDRPADSISPGNLSEWYNELKGREMKARRLFEAKARKFSAASLNLLTKMAARSLERIPEEAAVARAEKCLRNQFRRMLETTSVNRLDDQQLHQIRILSKEARYTLEMIDSGRGQQEERGGLNDKLRAIHQALGRWHDRQVALDSLTDFLRNRHPWPVNNPDEYGAYLSLLRQDKMAALQDFRQAWNEFVSDAKPDLPEKVNPEDGA